MCIFIVVFLLFHSCENFSENLRNYCCILAVEITANLFIEGASAFSFFKYVNIVYFLSNNNLFGEYLNVNIFSNPVNIIMVWTVVVTTLAWSAFWQCDSIYKNISNIEKSSIISAIAEFLQKHYRIRGSVKYTAERHTSIIKSPLQWLFL